MRTSKGYRTYRKKSKRTPRLLYLLSGGLFLLILFIFLLIGDYSLYQLYKLKKIEKQTERHIEELKALQDSLLVEQDRLQNDLKYIEKIAREKYRMAKKGEKVFKVIEGNSKRR